MGYQVTTVTPAYIAPIAAAELPSIRILPCVLSIRSTKNRSALGRLASAYSYPALAALKFNSAAFAFLRNCFLRAVWISSISTPSSLATTPS